MSNLSECLIHSKPIPVCENVLMSEREGAGILCHSWFLPSGSVKDINRQKCTLTHAHFNTPHH